VKVAYITSVYPAVSQTFILREVRALRHLGIDIITFSIRRASQQDRLGREAQEEAANTRWLVPTRMTELLSAVLWSVATRPLATAWALLHALGGRGRPITERCKWLAYFGEALLLAHWLSRDRFVHLHCHFGNSGSSTAALAARLARIPFSMTCHGSELREIARHRLSEKLAQAVFVACVSHFGKAQMMLAGAPDQWHKLHVVRCGLDAEFGSEDRMPSEKGQGVFEVLCVARLSAEKGHLVLIDAMAELRARGIEVHCTLVGDGPMRTEIERRIEQCNARKLISLTGALEPARVSEFYRSANVFVLPSFSEGVPVVLMEAMALECPVVATSVGGVPELVIHGETGLLVPPGDSRALANALQRIRQDPGVAAGLAANGRRHVRTEFRLDVSAQRLAALFRNRGRLTVSERDATDLATALCQPRPLNPSSY